MEYMDKLKTALDSIRRITDFKPKIGLVLGSGLGHFADDLKVEKTIPYSEIEGFPTSTVEGHQGVFIFAHIEGIPVVIMSGRVHYYEDYPMRDVVLPIRLMGLLGAKALFLTNAAGGVNPDFSEGTLMLIRDHIAALVPSPLIGKNLDQLGVRFPDMTNVYNNEMCSGIIKTAETLGISLKQGVYTQFTGPQYETPAEIRMAATFGADAVGMSTACEAIAANHMGLKVVGISCITNMAAGLNKTPLNHAEVTEVANRVAADFKKLVYHSIVEMGRILEAE